MKLDSEELRGELNCLADTLGEEGENLNNATDYILKLEKELKTRMCNCKESFKSIDGAEFKKDEWYHYFDDDGLIVICDDNDKSVIDNGSIDLKKHFSFKGGF